MTMVADTIDTAMRRVPTWVVYLLGLVNIVWLFWMGATGGLGVEPINALERELGETGLKLLVIGLAITPLRRFTGINLIRFRRAVGVTAFTYIVVHLSVWLVLDLQSFARIWSDILKRPYITIGMVAFTLMIPLAVTSNNLSLRKLGPLWRKLHKLTYIIVVLGGIHFVMVRKGIQLEPLFYLGVIVVLLAMRIKWRKPQGRLVRQRDTA